MAESDEVNLKLKVSDRARWSSEVNRAKKDVDDLGNASQLAARRAGSSAGGFGIFKSAISGMASVVKVGLGALGVLGAAAVVAGTKLFKMGEDAQQIRLRFTEVFTDLTPQMDNFIKTVNQKYGFPTVDLQNAAAQFGRFAQSAQLPHDKLTKFSQDMVTAGINLAAFYNKDPSVVFKAIQSGLAGLTRPLRQYGIFIEQSNIEAKAMQMGLGGTTLQQHKAAEAVQSHNIALAKQHEAVKKWGANSIQAASATVAVERAQDGITKATEGSNIKLTDAQKVMLRQVLIQEQMGAASGALDRRIDTTAGQMRIFTGRLKGTGYAIGTAVLPLANTLLHVLNQEAKPILDWLSKNAPVWTDKLSRGLGVVNTVLHDAMQAFNMGGFAGFAHSIDTAVGANGKLESALKRIGGDLRDVWRIITTGVIPAVLIVGGVVLWLAGKLTPLDAILHYLADRGWLVRDALIAVAAILVANAVATGALMAIEGTATVVKTLHTLATSGYTAALVANNAAVDANVIGAGVMQTILSAGLVRLTVSAGGWLLHAGSVAIDTASRYAWLAVNVIGGLIVEGIQLGIIVVKWIALSAVMAVQSGLRAVATGATWAWTAAQWALNVAMEANPVGLLIAAIVLLIGGIVVLYMHSKAFRQIVSEAFFFVWHVIMDVWHWVAANWPLLLAILLGPTGIAVLFVVRHWTTIKNAAMDVWHWIEHNWPMLLAIIIGPFGIAVWTVVHFFDQIRDGFKAAINFVIRAWNSLHFRVPEISAGPVHFGGFDIGTPHIPELHAGGMTVTPGVVNMRPGEEVVYLPQSAAVVPLPEPLGGNTTGTALPLADILQQLSQRPVVLVANGEKIADVVLQGTADIVARR